MRRVDGEHVFAVFTSQLERTPELCEARSRLTRRPDPPAALQQDASLGASERLGFVE